MASLSQIVVTIALNGTKYVSQLQQMASQTKQAAGQMQQSMQGVGKAHQATGVSADSLATKIKGMASAFATNIALFSTYYLSVGAITKILGGAISEFRILDEQLRNVQSITLQSDASIKELAKSLLGMVLSGKSAGQSASDLATAMYEVVSSGYKGREALEILELSAQGASAGLTTVKETSQMLMAILHSYKLPVSEAANVMDQLFTIVNLGVIHFADLNTNLGYLIPTAAALNIPLDQLGAAIAMLTRQGQMPSRVMTNLNSVLTQMLKPNEDLAAAIEGLGYASGSAMIKEIGLVGAVMQLAVAAGEAQESVGDFSAENLKITESNDKAIASATKSNERLQDRAKQAAQAAFDAHTRATRAAEALAIAEGKVRDGTATPSEILARNRAQDAYTKAVREAGDADEKSAKAAKTAGEGVEAKIKSMKGEMLAAKSVEEVDAVLARWFGDVRAIRAILPLAANNGRDFLEMWTEYQREIALGGRMQKALNEQQKSFNYQLKALTSNLKAVGAVLIGPVIGGFAKLLRVINGLFKKLVIFNDETKEVIFIWEKYPRIMDAAKVALAGIAAAIAVVLIPVLIALGQVIAGLIAGFALMLLTNPLGWAILAAAAIVMLLQATGLLGKAWDLLKTQATNAFKTIKEKVEDFFHYFKSGFEGNFAVGLSGFEQFAFDVGKLAADIKLTIEGIIETVGEIANAFKVGFTGGGLGGDLSSWEETAFSAGQVIKDIFDFLKKAIPEAIDLYLAFSESFFKQLFKSAKATFNFLKMIFTSDVAKELWESFKEGIRVIKDLVEKVLPKAKKQFDSISGHPVAQFLGKLVAWLVMAKIAWMALGAAIALITGPIGIAIAAIIGIIIVIGFVKRHWGEFVEFLRKTWASLPADVRTTLNAIWTIIKTWFSAVKIFWDAAWKVFKLVVEVAWTYIKGTIENGLKFITGLYHIFQGIWSGDWHKIWQGIKEIFTAVWNQIKLIVSTALDYIKGLLAILWGYIGDSAGKAYTAANNFAKGIENGLKDALRGLYNWVVDNVINPILGVYNSTIAKITGKEIDKVSKLPVAGTPATGMHTNIAATNNPYGLVYDPLGDPGDQYISPAELAMRNALRAQGHFASGVRNWLGGLAMVGEHGPEVAILPPGSSVANNGQTGKIMDSLLRGGGGGAVVNASFNVTAPTIAEIIRQLHQKVEELDRQMRYRAIRSGAPLTAGIM